MCLRCQGWSDAEVIDHYKALINEYGWAIVQVTGLVSFAYTIGLTRYHDHPELLVSGMHPAHVGPYLNDLGAMVAHAGHRFEPGEILVGPGRHRSQFLEVDDPDELAYAQAVYDRGAPVPALQAVFSDHEGRWPWTPDWKGCADEPTQPLFGTPHHA